MITDTSFIIDFMRNKASAVRKWEELESKKEPIMITALSLFELHQGKAKSRKPEAEKEKMTAALKNQKVLILSEDAAIKAGEILGDLDLKGTPIGPIDCLIAGIAKSEHESILTKNVKDFKRVPGLLVETY
jgi:tRNA(fMet)-specific endonuclease VapC